MTLDEALLDDNALLAIQSKRQLRYEAGELSIEPIGNFTQDSLLRLWERNRAVVVKQRHEIKSRTPSQ